MKLFADYEICWVIAIRHADNVHMIVRPFDTAAETTGPSQCAKESFVAAQECSPSDACPRISVQRQARLVGGETCGCAFLEFSIRNIWNICSILWFCSVYCNTSAVAEIASQIGLASGHTVGLACKANGTSRLRYLNSFDDY